jgi:hypothetical protein
MAMSALSKGLNLDRGLHEHAFRFSPTCVGVENFVLNIAFFSIFGPNQEAPGVVRS